MTTIKKVLSRVKAYQARGSGWVQILMSFGIITANIALFKDYIATWGIDVPQAIVMAGCLYFFGTVVIGFIDAKYGLWGEELAVSSKLNPVISGMAEKVNDLHNEVMDGSKKI